MSKFSVTLATSLIVVSSVALVDTLTREMPITAVTGANPSTVVTGILGFFLPSGQDGTVSKPAKQAGVSPFKKASSPIRLAKPNVNPYQRPEYDKYNTFLLLILQPHARATQLIGDLRTILRDDQIRQAHALIKKYDSRFAELRRRRSEILEYQRDQKLAGLLLENQQMVDLLAREIRVRIRREICTKEQLAKIRAMTTAKRPAPQDEDQ